MLPLDGSIADHAPDIVAAYARAVPKRDWPAIAAIDLTAGSCLFSLLLAAGGARRLVINDVAARSRLAASALFGGRAIRWPVVRRLIAASRPRLRPHVPSFHIASDYLTEGAADVFDRLYFARLPARDRPAYRYLALRWVQGFAPSIEEEFALLPTHDPRQLRADPGHDWSPYLRRLHRRDAVLKTLVRDINAGIEAMRGSRATLRGEDMQTLCRTVDYGRRAVVVVNPPTDGIDEYTVDDQLVHSLMENRWLPLSRSDESGARFWTKRVTAALRALPRGSHAIVWGGDGALNWRRCWRIWTRHAVPVAHRRIGGGRAAPGWAILEKR